jgi:hypothetical protein
VAISAQNEKTQMRLHCSWQIGRHPQKKPLHNEESQKKEAAKSIQLFDSVCPNVVKRGLYHHLALYSTSKAQDCRSQAFQDGDLISDSTSLLGNH